MLALKLARLKNNPKHKDSIVDFFGYLELYRKKVGIKIILPRIKFCQAHLTFKANSILSSCRC